MRSTMLHRNPARMAAALAIAAMFALPSAATAAEPFVPAVTDSSTGVLRELERRDARFIPGVTDSTTGVLRYLDRRGLELRGGDPRTDAAGSGLGYDDAAIAVAAAGVIASLAVIVAGGRRGRTMAA